MAMLRSLAEPSERMVARTATADIHLGIAAEAVRRLCGLWLAVVGGTRRRFSVQALSHPRLVMPRRRPAYSHV